MKTTDGRMRTYDATRVQTSPGAYAYFLEVAAEDASHAERIAGRKRSISQLSWFDMKVTKIETGQWLVKVAYVVE